MTTDVGAIGIRRAPDVTNGARRFAESGDEPLHRGAVDLDERWEMLKKISRAQIRAV